MVKTIIRAFARGVCYRTTVQYSTVLVLVCHVLCVMAGDRKNRKERMHVVYIK
jgi:hypothetical protein